MGNDNLTLKGSKTGKVKDKAFGSNRKINWKRVGGTLIVFSAICSFVKHDVDKNKLTLSPEYISYVDQVEDKFSVDLPEYMENCVNKYGVILEQINRYDEMTLNEQYNFRLYLSSEASFVESSSLFFLKDIGYEKYNLECDRTAVTIKFFEYPTSRWVAINDGSLNRTLNGDLKDTAESIYTLQGWKNDNGKYVCDWKNENEFSEFTSAIQETIYSTAYMMKNYVEKYDLNTVQPQSVSINTGIKSR